MNKRTIGFFRKGGGEVGGSSVHDGGDSLGLTPLLPLCIPVVSFDGIIGAASGEVKCCGIQEEMQLPPLILSSEYPGERRLTDKIMFTKDQAEKADRESGNSTN